MINLTPEMQKFLRDVGLGGLAIIGLFWTLNNILIENGEVLKAMESVTTLSEKQIQLSEKQLELVERQVTLSERQTGLNERLTEAIEGIREIYSGD